MGTLAKEEINIGKMLLEYNFITEEQLKEAETKTQKTNKEMREVLIELGYVTEGAINYVLSSKLDIPYVHLSSQIVDSDTVMSIPREILERYKMVPIIRVNDELNLVMADPTDREAIQKAESITGCSAKVSVGVKEEILDVIDRIFKKEITQIARPEQEVLTDMSGVAFVYHHLTEGLKEGVSQIYIEPAGNQIRIRYRMPDGRMDEKKPQPLYLYPGICSRLRIMANMDAKAVGLCAKSNVLSRIGDKEVYLHISVLPTLQGEAWTIKILEKAKSCPKLEDLGLPEALLPQIKQAINQSSGVIIVTGPPGSGRTTTAYSLLSELDVRKKKVLTIEDSVSYQNDGYNLIESSNPLVLESAISSSADVVMVEDINREEILKQCFNAALAGKLILGQMHHRHTFTLLDHLIRSGIGPPLIAETLLMVIAQRKVRLLCPSCKVACLPPEELGLKDISIYQAKGCPECNSTGYQGTGYLYEVLILNEPLKDILRQDKGLKELEENAGQNGFFSLKNVLREKLFSGVISLEEVS